MLWSSVGSLFHPSSQRCKIFSWGWISPPLSSHVSLSRFTLPRSATAFARVLCAHLSLGYTCTNNTDASSCCVGDINSWFSGHLFTRRSRTSDRGVALSHDGAGTSDVSTFLRAVIELCQGSSATMQLWTWWAVLKSLLVTSCCLLAGSFSLFSAHLCIVSFRSCWRLKKINAVLVKEGEGALWMSSPFLALATVMLCSTVSQTHTGLWVAAIILYQTLTLSISRAETHVQGQVPHKHHLGGAAAQPWASPINNASNSLTLLFKPHYI